MFLIFKIFIKYITNYSILSYVVLGINKKFNENIKKNFKINYFINSNKFNYIV